MNEARRFILKHLWWLVLVVSLVLLVTHSFKIASIAVDNTSLVLIVLILISPFAAAIKKIKIGEFEAEIEPEEVKKVAADAEKSLSETQARPPASLRRIEAVDAIRKLAETDPVVALAKLRIELETRLRKLHERARSRSSPKGSLRSVLPLNHLIRDLAAEEAIPFELGIALRGVMAICNRAIHGEDIRDADAANIIEAGTGLLEELESLIRQHAVTHPVSVEVTPRITSRKLSPLGTALPQSSLWLTRLSATCMK